MTYIFNCILVLFLFCFFVVKLQKICVVPCTTNRVQLIIHILQQFWNITYNIIFFTFVIFHTKIKDLDMKNSRNISEKT